MTQQMGPINAKEKLPWGWHFRPTGAELINNLKKQVKRRRQERRPLEPEDTCEVSEVLREIDLSRFEPWQIKEIPETCDIRAAHSDEHNQYFYTQKEQKYRHGKRSNRATQKGFWKATGRDKPIYGKLSLRDKYKRVVGYRKALVFYEGRAPNGNKTDWILHEYRLDNGPDVAAREDEQWVACHMFIKERNAPVKEPQDATERQTDGMQDQQWPAGTPEPVKEEPVYSAHGHYPIVNPTLYPGGPPLQYFESLPALEEDTYPVQTTRTEVANYQQPARPMTGRLPSFEYDHLHSQQMLADVLFNLYAAEHAQQAPTSADDSLWQHRQE